MVLNTVGMALIVASWAIQIMSMRKGKKEITKEFALLQAAGIACIAVGVSISTIVGMLNIASAVGAACVLVLLLRK